MMQDDVNQGASESAAQPIGHPGSPFADPARADLRPRKLRLVVLESPYAGDVDGNVSYARRALHDCLLRGEAPIASHLLLTQPSVLDDNDPAERAQGINAGHAWISVADAVVVYVDRGISSGMEAGINVAKFTGIPIEYRKLDQNIADASPQRHPRSEPAPITPTSSPSGAGSHVSGAEGSLP